MEVHRTRRPTRASRAALRTLGWAILAATPLASAAPDGESAAKAAIEAIDRVAKSPALSEAAIRAVERRLAELRGEAPGADDAATEPLSRDAAFFRDSVRPILENRCLDCHNPSRVRGGLDLTTRAGVFAGGESGAVVVAGNPEASLLYKVVARLAEPFMPHQADKLPDAEIATLADWIGRGLPFDEAEPAATTEVAEAESPEAAKPASRELQVGDADRDFWSFRPLSRPEPPAVGAEWARNDADRFVLAKLAEAGLAPSPEADRRALIRRVSFDLIGLPPSPEEVEAFVADPAPDAYERLVDRLLESPRHGERWARHWLDVARYADSDGYEFDIDRPNAYPYRDYVIKAFNRDQPFDEFAKWQIAGDEYAPDHPEALAALGFGAAGPRVDNQKSEALRYDELDDVVSTVGSAMLGLTLTCARCHDHKYDPVRTRDYYHLVAAFQTTEAKNLHLAPRDVTAAYLKRAEEHKAKLDAAKARLDEHLKPFREAAEREKIDGLDATADEKALIREAQFGKSEERKKLREKFKDALRVSDAEVAKKFDPESALLDKLLRAEIAKIEKAAPEGPPLGLALVDASAEPAESWLLARGNPDAKREKLGLGFPAVLVRPGGRWENPVVERPEDAKSTYRRRALAEWLVDLDDGAGALVARVMVNRIWGHHFGTGIVGTPNDFGMQGDRPTHPELLEWLASEFVASGWSVKAMHRLIATSAAYRQSAAWDEAKAAVDPDNRLLWRREPLRLEAEAIRDAMLAASGSLNVKMFGPSVQPKMHPDAIATGSTKKWPILEKDGPETWRRGVYVFTKRSVLMPMMESFDAPNATASCGRRQTTTIPQQALELLNGHFAIDQARILAERVRAEGAEPVDWIDRAYRLALGRAPRGSEANASLTFLKEQAAGYETDGAGDAAAGTPMELALADLCQTIFSLNEFVYVD